MLGARQSWFENGIELPLDAIKPLIKKIYPALNEVYALTKSLFHLLYALIELPFSPVDALVKPVDALVQALDFSTQGGESCIKPLCHLLKQLSHVTLVEPRRAEDSQHKCDNGYRRGYDGYIGIHQNAV
jgi:hypothetical protein